jgi:hypothetical protein
MIARRLLMGGGGALTVLSVAEFEVLATPKGGWTWFNDPRAIYYNGKTYFGYIDGSGDPYAAQYVHSTGLTSTPARLYPAASPFQVDDHDNPAFLIRDSDKRILAFFSTHFGTDQYINISTNPEDATVWDGPTNIRSVIGGNITTYANPVQLTGEANDPIYFFFRDHYDGTNTEWGYSKSTDGGVTWGSKVSVVRLNYTKNVPNGDSRIDFVGSPHADNSVEPIEHSIYHWYYQGGAWFKSDGSAAGSLPLAASSLTKVYSGAGAADDAWMWDIAIGGDGRPRIAYATFPSTSDHRYNYARWTGTGWVTSQIAVGGNHIYGDATQAYYSGGVVIDQSNVNVVYASIYISAGRWDIFRYESSDNGLTWVGTALTSSGKNVRPVSVRNHGAELQVLWMDGTYTTYTNYSVGTTGAGV